MSRTTRRSHRMLVVAAGACAIVGAALPAIAQEETRPPRIARAAQPAPPPPSATPYPGASVTIDPQWYDYQRTMAQPRYRHPSAPPVVYYVPVPVGYPYYQTYPSYPVYPSGGHSGGGVYDTNGRPLSSGFDAPVWAPSSQYGQGGAGAPGYPAPGYPAPAHTAPGYTPDVSGSPYVVIDGGAMVVDFGNGDRRAIFSCSALAAERAPDGKARTLFYRPPVDGLVLRAGQRGQVIGRPVVSQRSCYTADSYGRIVLDY